MTDVLKKAFLMAVVLSGVFAMTGGASAQFLPSLPENQLLFSPKTYSIDFQWQGDSINFEWEPHAALLLPVKLPSCHKQLFMQFDLGSPYSFFYSNKLKEVQAKYPKAIQLADSATSIKNYSFRVGDIPVHVKEIRSEHFSDAEPNGSSEKEIMIIGTIGADLIDSRVVLIDYPRRKISIGATHSPKVKLTQLSDFVYTGRSVLLPAIIRGKTTMLFFDTGSSAFELLTDQVTFDLLASPNAVAVHYDVKSWNNTLTAHTAATTDSLEIAFQKIPLKRVTYIEGASSAQVEHMTKMGIGGMTGNKLFINYKLLLDTKNKKFGIFDSSQKIN